MRSTVLIVVLTLALTALILVAMQCDGGAAPVSTLPPGATAPASSSGAYPAATGAPAQPTPTKEAGAYPAPALDFEKLLTERCGTTCHNLDRVKNAKKTATEWQTTVERMIAKGAKLTPEEAKALVNYLAQTYR